MCADVCGVKNDSVNSVHCSKNDLCHVEILIKKNN